MDLIKEDWERVRDQVEDQLRQSKVGMLINQTILDYANEQLKGFKAQKD